MVRSKAFSSPVQVQAGDGKFCFDETPRIFRDEMCEGVLGPITPPPEVPFPPSSSLPSDDVGVPLGSLVTVLGTPSKELGENGMSGNDDEKSMLHKLGLSKEQSEFVSETWAPAVPPADEEQPIRVKRPSPSFDESNQCETIEESGEESSVNTFRENVKTATAIVLMIMSWVAVFMWLVAEKGSFDEPDCTPYKDKREKSCDKCGVGTNVLPLLGEYERSWSKGFRAVFYLAGMLWIFMGMGIVCDQFMAGIEAITDSERIVRRIVGGTRRKFRTKVWNPTVANLTLMALGSSAPEILLTATELMGNDFFSASLGPQTIVGSAAFNMFVISAVCVAALPEGETKKIEGMDAFKITATFSLFAYIWLLIILVISSPQKVERWEGVVTLCLFFILITLAFLADKGLLSYDASHDMHKDFDLEKEQQKAMEEYGKRLPVETLRRLTLGPSALARSNTFGGVASKPGFKRTGTGMLSDDGTWTMAPKQKGHSITVGFRQQRNMVLECAGKVELPVILSKPLDGEVSMKYTCRHGSAKRDLRYTHVDGILTFEPGVTEMSIEVPIIDDDIWEPEEFFYVELDELKTGFASESPFASENGERRSSRCSQGSFGRISNTSRERNSVLSPGAETCGFSIRVAMVSILNDDVAGTLGFGADEVFVQQGTTATLEIFRREGWCGEVTCEYETIDDTAHDGQDYVCSKGTLCFGVNEKRRTLDVQILPRSIRQEARLKVRLSDPSPGVKFDAETDGGEECEVCDIVIAQCGDVSFGISLFRMFFNEARWEVAKELWREQRSELLYVGGSVEEQAEAGIIPWISHFIGLNWRITFLITPPPLLGGGWPCFVVALFLIGCVTMLAGDMASLLGCCLGIPDDITAITLVALGTSLPDTLASQHAALNDESADAAVGNVTGSNSVNVFLGAGISWTFGAFYWHTKGATLKWLNYELDSTTSFRDEFQAKYPDGGFIVPIPALTISVAVYIGCAFVCLALLAFRRRRYGGELGGPKFAQRRDACILFSLWVLFVVVVCVYSVANSKD